MCMLLHDSNIAGFRTATAYADPEIALRAPARHSSRSESGNSSIFWKLYARGVRGHGGSGALSCRRSVDSRTGPMLAAAVTDLGKAGKAFAFGKCIERGHDTS